MPQNKYQKFEPKGWSTNQLTFEVVGSEWERSHLDIIPLELYNMRLDCRPDLRDMGIQILALLGQLCTLSVPQFHY